MGMHCCSAVANLAFFWVVEKPIMQTGILFRAGLQFCARAEDDIFIVQKGSNIVTAKKDEFLNSMKSKFNDYAGVFVVDKWEASFMSAQFLQFSKTHVLLHHIS